MTAVSMANIRELSVTVICIVLFCTGKVRMVSKQIVFKAASLNFFLASDHQMSNLGPWLLRLDLPEAIDFYF